MSPFDNIIAHFERFPGVGVRQAKRFAFHIMTLKPEDRTELANLVLSLHNSVSECKHCHRYYAKNTNSTNPDDRCRICSDPNRDQGKLLVVARDVDIDAIERSGVYDGLYFVLGGIIPILTPNTAEPLRGRHLKESVKTRLADKASLEIILGFAFNPDGDNTARYVEQLLTGLELGDKLKLSYLARGLSTGSELEYADPDTIREALKHRL